MNQQKQSEDLHIGRGWLNRAAEMLDSCEDHVSDAEFARAAAAVGNGFIQLAAVEQWAAVRAEDVERQAARWAEEAPLTAAMVDAHQLAAELAQRQLDAINAAEERGGGLVATVRQRVKRAEAEGRPHSGPDWKSCAVCNPQAEARPYDDEPSVVYVVEGEETGVLHVAASEELAKAWIAEAGHGAYLVISELAVDRG